MQASLHKPPRRILALLAIVSSVVLSGAVWFESGPDPVIYPRQHIPVFFPHDYHVRSPDKAKGIQGEGLACDFCHENVEDSEQSSDRDIPGHDTCDTCHEEWIGDEDAPAPIEQCRYCHTDIEPSASSTIPKGLDIPAPNLKFPHNKHTEAGVRCTDCHRQVPSKTVATRDDFPTMDRCVGCHEDKGVSTECGTCHITQVVDRRIVTRFPEGQLMPRRFHQAAIHDADFLRDHAAPAMRDKTYCQNCHTESDCLECHDGVARDVRYHPGDFVSTHPIRARQDDYRCQSCHREQSFCLNCHIRSGVASVTAINPLDPGQTSQTYRRVPAPHPNAAEGWLTAGSVNFHGFQAQRNIRSCAGCHQEQYCIQCHGAGPASSRVNPHGADTERLRNSKLSDRNARVCLKCHDQVPR